MLYIYNIILYLFLSKLYNSYTSNVGGYKYLYINSK